MSLIVNVFYVSCVVESRIDSNSAILSNNNKDQTNSTKIKISTHVGASGF